MRSSLSHLYIVSMETIPANIAKNPTQLLGEMKQIV